MPSASEVVEAEAAPLDQSGLATGKNGLAFWWSNQLPALEKAAGTDLQDPAVPVQDRARLPTPSSGTRHRSSGRPPPAPSTRRKPPSSSTSWPTTKRPARPCWQTAVCTPNSDVRAAISAKLTPADIKVVKFIDQIKGELGEAPGSAAEGCRRHPGNRQAVHLRGPVQQAFDGRSRQEGSGRNDVRHQQLGLRLGTFIPPFSSLAVGRRGESASNRTLWSGWRHFLLRSEWLPDSRPGACRAARSVPERPGFPGAARSGGASAQSAVRQPVSAYPLFPGVHVRWWWLRRGFWRGSMWGGGMNQGTPVCMWMVHCSLWMRWWWWVQRRAPLSVLVGPPCDQ